MGIIFATNSPKAFTLQPTESTIGRDSDYVTYGLRFPVAILANDSVASYMNFPAPSGTLIWFHTRMKFPGNDAGGMNNIFEFQDADGNSLVRLSTSSASLYLRVLGDTEVNDTGSGIVDGNVTEFDIKIDVGANIVVEVYRDGVLDVSGTAANTGGKGVARKWKLLHNGMFSDGTSYQPYYSEIFIDDVDSTIGCRLAELLPDADGNHTEWGNGDYSDLADFDTATKLIADADGERQTWSLSAYGGATPLSVRGVVSELDAATYSASLANLTAMLRISSTDYYGSADDLGENGARVSQYVWDENPDTVSAWAIGDLATLEAGMRGNA